MSLCFSSFISLTLLSVLLQCTIRFTLISSLVPQLMDSSRSDWWLVSLPESGQSGWVPADYLEKKTLELEGRVASPRPEPFHGETGKIERVLKRCVTWFNGQRVEQEKGEDIKRFFFCMGLCLLANNASSISHCLPGNGRCVVCP